MVRPGDVVVCNYQSYSEETTLLVVVLKECMMYCRPFAKVISKFEDLTKMHRQIEETGTPAIMTQYTQLTSQ